jgi:hypothetical protein
VIACTKGTPPIKKIKKNIVARELQRALGWPSRADLITALRAGTIVDCPVTHGARRAAHHERAKAFKPAGDILYFW